MNSLSNYDKILIQTDLEPDDLLALHLLSMHLPKNIKLAFTVPSVKLLLAKVFFKQW
jgi:hypothetical protein